MTDTALAACLALVKSEEGCVLHPYQDVAGNWTIGYGNTYMPDGTHVTAHTPPVTQVHADAMLLATITPMLTKVQGWVQRDLTPAQWASLVSFCYNLGAGVLFHSSLLTAVKAGYMSMAAMMFAPYVHSGGRVIPGLVARRAREAAAFGKVAGAFVQQTVSTAPVAAPQAEADALMNQYNPGA